MTKAIKKFLIIVSVYVFLATCIVLFGGDKTQPIYKDNQELKQEAMAVPACAPSQEMPCLLNEAISRLEEHRFLSDETFQTLRKLSNTAIRIDDRNIMERIIQILEKDKIRALLRNKNRRITLMRLQLALGNFDKGFKILNSFKNEIKKFEYNKFPPNDCSIITHRQRKFAPS